MMQRGSLVYDTRLAAGDAELNVGIDAIRRFSKQPFGDDRRELKARSFTAILEQGGLGDLMKDTCAVDVGQLRDKGLAEDSIEWLAAFWLGAFNRLVNERERLETACGTMDSIKLIVEHAEELGRLEERIWWRCGVDPQTDKPREALAVGKRNQELSCGKATEARRVQAQDAKPEWHEWAYLDALERRKIFPSHSRWRIAGSIHEKYSVSQDRCAKILKELGLD
ncbi:hypothetical protein G5B39_10505 [Rhodobacteraceae bacterium SC52]|nr:hypothetical protein G5B39_10505 [Rhodobacteraceae bacterium SC52]